MKQDESIKKMEEALTKKKEERKNAILKKIDSLELRCKKKNEQREGLTQELLELDGMIDDLKSQLEEK